jgi:RNA polymerase sigma-70 factor, ECF subfamily
MNCLGPLLEKEIPRLRRYARALTRDGSRADDLVQDTLVRAIAKQHRWQCGTNLRAWLFTIMHNQNVNVVRASVREGIAAAVDEASPHLVARSDPTAALSLRDLDRALARIPAEQRAVLLLIGLEGITYEEAATILDVPIGTVRSRLSRGRESLRKLMDWRDDFEGTNGAAITSAKATGRQVPEVARSEFRSCAGVDASALFNHHSLSGA